MAIDTRWGNQQDLEVRINETLELDMVINFSDGSPCAVDTAQAIRLGFKSDPDQKKYDFYMDLTAGLSVTGADKNVVSVLGKVLLKAAGDYYYDLEVVKDDTVIFYPYFGIATAVQSVTKAAQV